jgi:hypothetical protein
VGVLSASQMIQETFEAKYEAPLDALETRMMMYAYASKLEVQAALEQKAEEEAAANDTATGTEHGKKGKAKRRGKSAATSVKAEYPDMTVAGTTISPQEIEQLVHEAVDTVSQEIASFIQSSWRQSDATNAVATRFSPVIAIGGGVKYFFRLLRLRIPHLQMPSDPSFANAQGYAQTAVKLLMRKWEKKAAKAS